MTFLSLFLLYMGPAPLELFMVDNIFLTYSPQKVFPQNMAKFLYMTLLLCCWYWVCEMLLFSVVTE